MSKEEVAWVKPYNLGDTVLFISDKGDSDLLITRSIKIYNSLNPVNVNFSASSVFEAKAYLNYDIIHNGVIMKGWLGVKKEKQGFPIKLRFVLCDRYALNPIEPNYRVEHIRNLVFNDCIVIDNSNSEMGKNQPQICDIKKLIWSKSKGLLQYSFENGEIYTIVGK